MNAVDVLERLSALGVQVTPRPNGNLWLEPASVIPPDLLEVVRQHKTEVLDYLRRKPIQDAWEPWVLREWRRVSIPQWRDILRESTAQGDEERKEYACWMLREVLLDTWGEP